MNTNKATCTVCGKRITLTATGSLRNHGTNTKVIDDPNGDQVNAQGQRYFIIPGMSCIGGVSGPKSTI